MGDYVKLLLTLKNSNDSIIFDSHHHRHHKHQAKQDSSATVKFRLRKSFHGCLPEGIVMMAVGDSASFKVSADSLYLKTFHSKELPPFVKSGDILTFYVKLVDFKTPQQAAQDMAERMKKREAIMEKRKAEESGKIAKYISDNNVKVKPDSNGIYILQKTAGKGKVVQSGDSVEVKYTGMLLDSTVVESSDHGPGRTTFTFVYGKDNFNKGFDYIISTLKEGGEVKALIPSALAYGEQRQGLILPYSPLLYDVQVVKVK